MNRLSKIDRRRRVFADILSIQQQPLWNYGNVEKMWNMNIRKGFGYTLWGFGIPKQLCEGEIICFIPDIYLDEWTIPVQNTWKRRFTLALKTLMQIPQSIRKSLQIHMYILPISDGVDRLQPIDTNNSVKILQKTHINRGFTRMFYNKTGKRVIDLVVFNSNEGIVFFHELFHTYMYALGQSQQYYMQTPYGKANYMEMLAEVYGNIMASKYKQAKIWLESRIDRYRGQAIQLSKLLKTRKIEMRSEFISYLMGTYIVLRNVMQRGCVKSLTWQSLSKKPELLLLTTFYSQCAPRMKDWEHLAYDSVKYELPSIIHFVR